MKRCLFPGSFDPFTKGHEAIVDQALEVFDEVYIGIGVNSKKTGLFSLSQKINHVGTIYKDNSRVFVSSYEHLSVVFCNEINATHIVRGLRDVKDFEYERSIRHMNHAISKIETVFFISDPKNSAVNSSIIRELYQNGADITQFVTRPELLV